MNTLKLSNSLLFKNCHLRFACSALPDVRKISGDSKNVNTANLIRDVGATKFLYSGSNKIGAFSLFDGRGPLKNFPVAASNFSVRSFSDSAAPILPVTSVVQLDGIWKILAESAIVEFCQNGFVALHLATGLPWWATIVLGTWAVRATVTLPLAIYQYYIAARVVNLTSEMDVIVKRLKEEAHYAMHKFGWDEQYAKGTYIKSVKREWQKLIERDNCHPMKGGVLILVQIPMWIALSTSLRNLCYMLPYPTGRAQEIYLELTTGGFGWVTNLAATDPYYAIPVALGLLNLAILEIQVLIRRTAPGKQQVFVTNFFRVIAVGMIPLASMVPAGVSLYWASSSAFGLAQNLLFQSPNFRRLVGIPLTKNELEEPYKYLYSEMRQRLFHKAIPPPGAAKKHL